jgi:putative component of membrane protein insertase Oxa1/YidC/SpoIIIJ protein YidD
MAFEFVISMLFVTLLKEYKVCVSTFMFNECIYVVWSPYTVWYVLGYIGRTREVTL